MKFHSVLILGVSCLWLFFLGSSFAENTQDTSSSDSSSLKGPLLKASAQISLAEIFTLAEQHNSRVLEAKEKLKEAAANIGIAREIPNPQLQLAYGFGPTTTQLGNTQLALVQQTLEVGGKRKARTSLAQSQYILAQNQLESLLQELRATVREAYIDLIAAEKNAENLAFQEKLLLELVEIAKKRFQYGAAPEAEVLQATLAHDQIIPQQASAEGNIRQSKIALNAMIGNALPTSFEVQNSSFLQARVQKTQLISPNKIQELPSVDDLLGRALGGRKDLQASLQQVDVAKKQVKVTQSLRYPDVQVGGGYSFLYANQVYFQGAMTSLQTTLPLYHNQKYELLRDQSQLRQSEIEQAVLRQQIEKDVRTAYTALQTSQINLELYDKRLIPASIETTQLAKLSYQVGKTGLANVILAQQAAQQVQTGYVDALISYHKAVSDLERAIGGTLE